MTIHTYIHDIRGCQSGTWSQKGTKVNGSHHGDNPLLRQQQQQQQPTVIKIATKSYATLPAMVPTNIKTVHQTSLLHIYIREQPRSTRIVVAYPQPAFSAANRTNHVPTSFDQQVQVIKCQSRLWPQRGTKVNGSRHDDNLLLRPTGYK